MVTEYWDLFCEYGFRRPIQGFSFQIDTGKHQPICCKPTRYDLHESEVMQKLLESLDENGVVEEDDRPWGALVVILGKPRK